MKRKLFKNLGVFVLMISILCGTLSLSAAGLDGYLYIVNGLGQKILLGYNGPEKNVIIPNGVSTISPNAFMGKEIESVHIPASVYFIMESAFENSSNLKKVTINNGVRFIGIRAFCGCKNLETINIPPSINVIGKQAFGGCDLIKNMEIPKSVSQLGVLIFEPSSPIWSPQNTSRNSLLSSNDFLERLNCSNV